MFEWQELGAVAPKSLVSTRSILHWAAQIPSAAGSTLLPARKDSSQTSLSWDDGLLVGAHIGEKRAALRFADLHLVVLDPRGAIATKMPLAGKTLAAAIDWLSEAFGKKLERPSHELPDHSVAKGEAFSFSSADAKAAAELARWFDDARIVLDGVFKIRAHAAPIRCWPHHFDIATLIAIDSDKEYARSVGVGLSPGDASYDEPYFYVTPWPYPEGATLQPLEIGTWHTKGWTGAILTATKLIPATQHETAIGFVDGAIDCCLELLGASGA